ncbi:MAG TPA: TadE family protein [Polyangia bacterium]
MRRRSGERRVDRGVAAVEFALLLPILLGVTLGAIDWGYFFFVKQRVVNAAREGARAGAVIDPDDGWAEAQTTAQEAAEAYLTSVGLTAQGVDVVQEDIGGTDGIKVTITYPTGSLTGYLSSVLPANAVGISHMRWE